MRGGARSSDALIGDVQRREETSGVGTKEYSDALRCGESGCDEQCRGEMSGVALWRAAVRCDAWRGGAMWCVAMSWHKRI